MKGLFQCPPWARSFCPFRACCYGLHRHQGELLWAYWASGRAAMGFLTSGRAAMGFLTSGRAAMGLLAYLQPLCDSCPCGRIPQNAALLLARPLMVRQP